MRTSFHHQPEAQHPKSPAIETPAGRFPHLLSESDHPVADERGQRIAAFAPALVAGDLQRIELAHQVAEGDWRRRGASLRAFAVVRD